MRRNKKFIKQPKICKLNGHPHFRLVCLCLFTCILAGTQMSICGENASVWENTKVELLEAKKIWDKSPHNAFTDLVRFKGSWYCTFRESKAHVSPDGALRVITSKDGGNWTSAALITSKTADLRDPKLTVTSDNRLMLYGGAALHKPADTRHQSMVWFSDDGSKWSKCIKVGDKNIWLWRVTWHKGTAYGIGYSTVGKRFIRLYKSRNGRQFDTLVDNLFDEGSPSETSIIFLEDDTALCLLRRDASDSNTAQLGIAKSPYKKWKWKDLGKRLGGPHLLQLPDGKLVAAGRLYDKTRRTALCWLDPGAGTLEEFLALPPVGYDTSYPGLVWYDGVLWVSYYSGPGNKDKSPGFRIERTSIYLAKVKLH